LGPKAKSVKTQRKAEQMSNQKEAPMKRIAIWRNPNRRKHPVVCHVYIVFKI
jgi:hypothetical protein